MAERSNKTELEWFRNGGVKYVFPNPNVKRFIDCISDKEYTT